MQTVRALEMNEVSFRSALLISRACAPTTASPISPSSSDFVTEAATESTTMTSRALERTSVSQMARFFAGARLRDQQVVEIDAYSSA